MLRIRYALTLVIEIHVHEFIRIENDFKGTENAGVAASLCFGCKLFIRLLLLQLH